MCKGKTTVNQPFFSFLFFRKVIKAAEVYLECECTMSIEDHKAKIKGCQDGCLNRDLKMVCLHLSFICLHYR